MKASILYSKI